MNVKPLCSLQTAFDLKGAAFDARFGPVTAWRLPRRLSEMKAGTVTDDVDPDHNKLEWEATRAQFAQPAYDAWWKCWEDEGWVSLGRTRNFDWMHVQAARV